MMSPEDNAKALLIKDAAMDQYITDDLSSEFYRDLMFAIQDLHTSAEEQSLDDLPADMAEYVAGLNLPTPEPTEAPA